MTINYRVTGPARKKLVIAISEITNQPLNYLGAPSFEYRVGEFCVDREGVLTGPDNTDLVAALTERGYYVPPAAITFDTGAAAAQADETLEPDAVAAPAADTAPESEAASHTEAESVAATEAGDAPDGALETGAAKADKRNLPRLYTLDTPRGEIFIAEEFATHEEAAAEGYGEWFSTVLGTIYGFGDDRTFAVVTSHKAGDWDTTKMGRDFRAAPDAADAPDYVFRTYQAELSDPECPDRMEIFSAEDDEDAIRQAYEFAVGEVLLLELLEMDDDYNIIRSVDLPPNPYRLTIEHPLDGFDPAKLDNLCKLVTAKAPLLKAALGADDLPIQHTADSLRFPWFFGNLDGEHTDAYATLISMLCKTAKEKKRVTAKEKEIGGNPKYAMRCFLLSLGMIGPEFRIPRRILLERLEGNSSFGSQDAYNAMQKRRRKAAAYTEEVTGDA